MKTPKKTNFNKLPYKRNKTLIKFFKRHNLGFGQSSKIDWARYYIAKIFYDNIFYTDTNPDYNKLIEQLKETQYALEYLYKIYDKTEKDRRSGSETYGFDNWQDTINYISDRWECQFRVRWILDLIDYLDRNEKDKI